MAKNLFHFMQFSIYFIFFLPSFGESYSTLAPHYECRFTETDLYVFHNNSFGDSLHLLLSLEINPTIINSLFWDDVEFSIVIKFTHNPLYFNDFFKWILLLYYIIITIPNCFASKLLKFSVDFSDRHCFSTRVTLTKAPLLASPFSFLLIFIKFP